MIYKSIILSLKKKKQMNKIILLGLGVVIILFNSCSGCVKKVSKKITETGVSAVEGVTEVLDENAEKLGDATATIAIKVIKGAGKSLDRELYIHAKDTERQGGSVVVTDITTIDVKELNSIYQKIAYEQDGNGVSVKFVGKIDTMSVYDSFITFSKKGNYNCNIEVSNVSGHIVTKETQIQIDSVPQSKIISFSANSLENIPVDDLYFVVSLQNQRE